MFRAGVAVVFLCASVFAGDQLTVVSAASSWIGVSPGSLATISGTHLSRQFEATRDGPWPTTLGGISVEISDSQGVIRNAGLLYVSPTQINLQVPPDAAIGAATALIHNDGQSISAKFEIQPLAPALFHVDHSDLAAATATRVVLPSKQRFPVATKECEPDRPTSCNLSSIRLSPNTRVYLSLYGTGLGKQPGNVIVTIGSLQLTASYAGPQPHLPGRDEIDVLLPLSLRGAGKVSVTISVDGVRSNPVNIALL